MLSTVLLILFAVALFIGAFLLNRWCNKHYPRDHKRQHHWPWHHA